MNYFNGSTRIYLRKSNGMSEKSIENMIKSDSIFTPSFVNHDMLPDVNFKVQC